MLARIREILLTQYIGSILIALLLLQAAIEVLTRILRVGFWAVDQARSASVMGRNTHEPFAWDSLVFSIVTVALYLLLAYGLAGWLFPATVQNHPDDEAASMRHAEQ